MSDYNDDIENENIRLRNMVSTIIEINRKLRATHSELKDSYNELMITKEHHRDRVFELRSYTESLAEKLHWLELEYADLQTHHNQMKNVWMHK